MAPKRKQIIKQTYEFPLNFTVLGTGTKQQHYVPIPEVVMEGQIITIPNFLTSDLCNELIASFEKNLKMETTPLIKSKDYAVRVNDRALVNDIPASLSLWSYLKKVLLRIPQYDDELMESVFKEFVHACGLNPQLRMYRYRKGHHFGKHYDESNVCSCGDSSGSNTARGRTKWTLLVYLSGGAEFNGGGTIFYGDGRGNAPLNIHPSKGMALLHKHGDDCLLHEAELVTAGEKWVLRSDVVFAMT